MKRPYRLSGRAWTDAGVRAMINHRALFGHQSDVTRPCC